MQTNQTKHRDRARLCIEKKAKIIPSEWESQNVDKSHRGIIFRRRKFLTNEIRYTQFNIFHFNVFKINNFLILIIQSRFNASKKIDYTV